MHLLPDPVNRGARRARRAMERRGETMVFAPWTSNEKNRAFQMARRACPSFVAAGPSGEPIKKPPSS